MLFSQSQTAILHDALAGFIKDIENTFEAEPQKKETLPFLEGERLTAIAIQYKCEHWYLIQDRTSSKQELWVMLRALSQHECITHYNAHWYDKDSLYGKHLNEKYEACANLKQLIDKEYHDEIRKEVMA